MNKNVLPKEAAEKIISGITVLDVRTPEEYAEGHIAGSLNINISAPDFPQKISALDKDKEYLVYCRSGGRSSAAQGIMAKAGFRNASNLLGGITSWMKEGRPVEK